MEGSSAFQFGRAAYKAGLLSRRRLIADAWANIQFRLRGASDDDTHALRNRISASLAGTRVRDLERLGADVLAGILPRLYPEMLRVAYDHQDAGRRVYIATAASNELAQMLAGVLGFDGAVGSQFSESVDGVYTGRPAGLFIYGSEKAEAIRQLAERERLDLAASYAYSDSESDLPMLEVVGHPVVVNPDRPLLQMARANGWEVLRFDRLGRRLQVTMVTLTGAAAAGGVGTAVLARRTRSLRRRTRSLRRRTRSLRRRSALMRRLWPRRRRGVSVARG
jgi:HAD superfamily hydrolase (TIGR01490 family)